MLCVNFMQDFDANCFSPHQWWLFLWEPKTRVWGHFHGEFKFIWRHDAVVWTPNVVIRSIYIRSYIRDFLLITMFWECWIGYFQLRLLWYGIQVLINLFWLYWYIHLLDNPVQIFSILMAAFPNLTAWFDPRVLQHHVYTLTQDWACLPRMSWLMLHCASW